jgi:serine/threonine-protein kinase
MTTIDLGACEWFVWDLRRSNLLDRGQLDQVVGEFLQKNPRAEPTDLAQYLVEQEILTSFQAERLLQSKTQGLVLGPYTLMDALGTGSMGTVYKALSKTNNQWYAVKVLPRRSMWNVRIARRQVRAFEQCQHPAVVPFVDVGTAGSTHFLAWPLVEGEPLDRLVEGSGKLEPGLVAQYALQIAEGLDACHQHDLIHGLLKPSNIMIDEAGQVHILDYGIGMLLANSEGESLVDTMSTANSLTSGLDCASPECIMEPSNRTAAGDQYSLGCLLYFCLTGRYPFPDGTAVEKMMAHQTKQPTPIRELAPEVPEEWVTLIDRLMQKSPEARFAHTAEVIEAIRPLMPASTMRAMRPALAAMRPEAGARAIMPKERINGERHPAVEPPSARVAVARANLPTRQSLRPDTAAAAVQTPPPAVQVARPPLAQAFVLEEPRRRSLEERFGMVGIIAGVLLAAGVTWLVSLWLFQ